MLHTNKTNDQMHNSQKTVVFFGGMVQLLELGNHGLFDPETSPDS